MEAAMSTTTNPHTEGADGTAQRERAEGDDQNSISNSNEERDVEMDDAEHEVDELAETKSKKKRRVIKTFDKKYECPAADCGKAYSRAEHLYRHQLNHTPKQIYHCDFPGCDRHFVRADLCSRHRERHTAKGSHLQRKDAFMHSQRVSISKQTSNGPNSPLGEGSNTSPTDSAHTGMPSSSSTHQEQFQMAPPVQTPRRQQSYPTSTEQYSNHSHLPPVQAQQVQQVQPVQSVQVQQQQVQQLQQAQQAQGGAPGDPHTAGQGSYNAYQNPYDTSNPMEPHPTPNGSRRYSMESQYSRSGSVQNGYALHQQMPVASMPPPPPQPHVSSQSSNPAYSHSYQSSGSNLSSTFQSPQTFSTLPALPEFGMPQSFGGAGTTRSNSTMSPPPIPMEQYQMPTAGGTSIVDYGCMDQFGNALPVFNSDGFNRSPNSLLDENVFYQLLESGVDLGGDFAYDTQAMPPPPPKMEPSTPAKSWESESSSSHGMDLTMRESVLTERKQARIIALVRSFEDPGDMPGRRTKEEILKGDPSDQYHALSLNMMKTYITSYWIHIHQQMPILHRPTFNSETCPDLLLLAIMCLGACCLERTHSEELIKTCAELSFFSAYHIRWEVFKDAEFRPTAKLWTFQTMLLLELFEKMYSTRALHERAHIHHATTLTVMRRGSSLIGRCPTDTSSAGVDPTRTPPGPEGSINTSGVNTSDAYWNRWITAEATRRVAFAAFVIDSTHATLFGHSAAMSPHDIRLPLPCDEALWSATSRAEVQRIQASLSANGFRPLSFQDGLRMMLNGQKVRTNTFGRVILMAGMLNFSWHMNQRDLQITSLGATAQMGNTVRWRSHLTRTFDFWRDDFDDSLSKDDQWSQVWNPETKSTCHADHHDNVFESRTCLHSLAHMAMHVDIVDLEVFAGADRALGRIVTESDRTAVTRKMRDQWAPSARARDATYYALQFLRDVLMQGSSTDAKQEPMSTIDYSARDDYLLNRPWILYFAMMTVWAYGFALDGPITAPVDYNLSTRDLQIQDAQQYLLRMGGNLKPDDLEHAKNRGACLGLLLLLQHIFSLPRWELAHEASSMLGLCIKLSLAGKEVVQHA